MMEQKEVKPFVTETPSLDRLKEIDERKYATKDIFQLLDDLDWLVKTVKEQQQSIEFLKEDIGVYIKRGDSWRDKFLAEKEKNTK